MSEYKSDYKMIPFRLIEQKEKTNNLVVVLPGAGYTTQAPLLHYTTGLFYTKGFDVLHVNYTYNRQELADLSEEDFAKDVQLAINEASETNQYDNYYIVAKSIGTIALSYLLNNQTFKNAKVVWLTPLLQRDDVFNAMRKSEHRGFCIIGDQDSCFIEERMATLKHNEQLKLQIVEGGNHSLELNDDPLESIDVLKRVISKINEFSVDN
ncbi:alpha/beta family hydrolase [Alkalihalophilus pseudofirmus]|uniref:Alpha/beta family hydrolase n=1 Tax=Alkalihalophilus pseudofirmus TaxID=79885 RepID=A0AAJ2NLQ0_ALKPS|nr:alpha/beta family hydrolase [Alkalihalophilus pseudofirmus]MDV2884628.1 alpha/beta family hydrolase [Alkalihalophilus pseudofirmus]